MSEFFLGQHIIPLGLIQALADQTMMPTDCLYVTLSYKLTQILSSNTFHMYSEESGTNLQQVSQVLRMTTTPEIGIQFLPDPF